LRLLFNFGKVGWRRWKNFSKDLLGVWLTLEKLIGDG